MSEVKTESMPKNVKKRENLFLTILVNVILPSFVLEKGSAYVGSGWALAIGISIPLIYGLKTFTDEKRVNFIALMGLLNVGLSGALAVSGKGGIWFAIKEAGFPLLIGIFVLASTWTRMPFIEKLLMNPDNINSELLHEKLKEKNNEAQWFRHIQVSNILFSLSFFLSAYLNFSLAREIFSNIDPNIEEIARATLLNEQMGAMTRRSYLYILVPSVISTFAVLIFLLRGIRKLSGVEPDKILKSAS